MLKHWDSKLSEIIFLCDVVIGLLYCAFCVFLCDVCVLCFVMLNYISLLCCVIFCYVSVV